jgi:phosphatidylglycerol:prolipoprotein diacylglycerol transferase
MQAIGLTTAYYFSNPIEILMVWKGGLGIPGAVVGGALGLWLFTRRNRLPFAVWADLAAPGLAMGQAIGRWGNYVNQELFGRPTRLPWGIAIDPAYATPLGFTDSGLRFHPLFLYESLANLAICLGLLWLARRLGERLKPGDVFLAYLVAYPTVRFLLEFMRIDSPLAAASGVVLNINQVLMLVVALVATLALALRTRRTRRYQLRAQAG